MVKEHHISFVFESDPPVPVRVSGHYFQTWSVRTQEIIALHH